MNSAVSAQNLPIKVLDLTPEPNYRLTKDKSDIHQLTDGVKNKFPIWTNRNSVGWSDNGLVILDLGIPDTMRKGYLRIHTASGVAADVKVPKRIDVYGVNKRGGAHIASIVKDDLEIQDKKNIAIDIPFYAVGYDYLTLVIRRDGKFLMLDEIELFSLDDGLRVPSSNMQYVTNVKADAEHRYRDDLIKKFERAEIENGKKKQVKLIDPWIKNPDSAPEIQSWDISGAYGTRSIAIYSSGYKEIFLKLNGLIPKEAVSLYRGEQLITASEEMVFDPLLDVSSDSDWISFDKQQNYLLLSVNLDLLEEGRYSGEITIQARSGNLKDKVRRDIYIEKKGRNAQCDSVAVNLWAYRKDRPIWTNRLETRDYLLSNIANYVAVINPWELGMSKLSVDKQMKRLEEQFSFYKNAQQILVFLAWDKIFKDGIDKEWLKAWVQGAHNAALAAGIHSEQWALYPVDEVDNTRFKKFIDIIHLIKSVDKNTRVYANPIHPNTLRKQLSFFDIKKAGEYIDIWQPDARLARKYNRFFRQWGDDFWIYDNPKYPAKSQSPKWYRELPEKAVSLGAKGVGFWSFSDTSRTTAWDDLDGRRADWAVVYEARVEEEGSFVLSRRWLAFLEGLDVVVDRGCQSL